MARTAQSQTLSASLSGDKEVQAAIARIIRATSDLRPAWDEFYRPGFHKAMDFRFERKVGWRPLKAEYAAWKAKHGGGDLMVLTGALRASLAGQTGESVYQPTPNKMTIGSTNIPTNTPRGRMVIWAADEQMRYEMTQAAKRHAEWFGRTWERGV